MIALWIAAALLAAGSAMLMAWRAGRPAGAAADPAAAVYRRQLGEIDDLADRGLLGDDERRAARAETGRRLLAAAEAPAVPVRGLPDRAIFAIAVAPALAAFALYLAVGDARQPDQPFAPRLATWREHPEAYGPQELAALLEDIAAHRPTDPEPLVRLADLKARSGDADGALRALARATAVDPSRVDAWALRGELTVLKAGGDVGPEAQAMFRRALALDPASATARYYLGRGKVLHGDVAGGLADWRALAASLAPSDERLAALNSEIAQVQATGKPVSLVEPAPARPQITDAIRQMVDGLAARLKANPDDPQGWVRLVRAYSVMGETAKRDAALSQARARYAGDPAVLSQLNAAAAPPGS